MEVYLLLRANRFGAALAAAERIELPEITRDYMAAGRFQDAICDLGPRVLPRPLNHYAAYAAAMKESRPHEASDQPKGSRRRSFKGRRRRS